MYPVDEMDSGAFRLLVSSLTGLTVVSVSVCYDYHHASSIRYDWMAPFEVDVMEMFYKSVLLTPDFTALISSRHNLLRQIRYTSLRLVASYQPIELARATV